MREMKGWLAGALIFFSANLMAQSGQNYKQQFSPSKREEKDEQQKYYGTVEDENHYRESHNYKNTFSKHNKKTTTIIEDCDEAIKSYPSHQKMKYDLPGGEYIEHNYKRSFPARKE
ncbi:hypothetical protein [Sporocytophaga myxococcoides]|nr:hypothetical protein [Sporocytophaga myxococcoides]